LPDAAIHIDKPVGDDLGRLSVGALTDVELPGFMVNISGYPFDKGAGGATMVGKKSYHAS
jgi:hypothetical protein